MPGRVPGPLRLAVFDLDGTLVPKTTVCLHLAEWMGHLDVLRELERRYAAHEISNTEVAALDAPHYACEMSVDGDGRLAGSVARHIEAEDKLAFVAEYATARGISLEECVAVGDSRSDLPLFGAVGLAIALNASPAAVAVAHVAIETDDLREVLAVIPDQ